MAKKSTKKNQETHDFETSIANLEQIIAKMESDKLSLNDSLKSFEEGIKLTSHCQELLANAQQTVEILMQEQEDKFQEFALDSDYEEDDNE